MIVSLLKTGKSVEKNQKRVNTAQSVAKKLTIKSTPRLFGV